MLSKQIIIVALATGMMAAATSQAAEDPNNPVSTPSSSATDQKAAASQPQPLSPGVSPHSNARQNAMASHDALPMCDRASRIMGMEVRTADGEKLGRVQDIIVSLEADRAPFAIIRSGGAFGFGQTRTAVPLKDLKFAEDHRQLTLATTKDQFAAAGQAPNGSWTGVADQDWAKGIDRFYGQPSSMEFSRSERQEMGTATTGQEYVRTPVDQEKGAEHLKQGASSPDSSIPLTAPTSVDEETKASVSKLLKQRLGDTSGQDIQVNVDQGVVTLKGGTANADLQRQLDQDISKLPGVKRVDDLLTPTSKDH